MTGVQTCALPISVTVVNEISGNLILQVKEARIALDKTLAMRIIVA